ncbi:hypothetical protein MXB_4646 [Myxobolus squamalis]|nr:hypothetical protein MXB_4646 [Myxobolus squamalis]
MAQSEAYYNSHEWIKYFLHTGHLTIDGCKMSKSLKNFITIKQALEKYTSRQIRLAFIMHQWNGPLDFSVNIMNEACQFDKKINDFIMRISSLINENNHTTSYTIIEKQLQNIYIETHENVHIAICDNIDTPKVISQIQLLISATNTYVASKNMENLYNMLLINIIKYIQYIFSIFGADYSLAPYSNEDNNLLLQQLAQQVALFRFEIRKIGITENNRDILSLCDSFRDINLFDLGIKLEDKGIDKLSTVMISTPEDLLEEREAEARRKNVSASIHPSKLFLTQTDKYSQFDQEILMGILFQNLMKLYEQQKQLHEKYIAGNK